MIHPRAVFSRVADNPRLKKIVHQNSLRIDKKDSFSARAWRAFVTQMSEVRLGEETRERNHQSDKNKQLAEDPRTEDSELDNNNNNKSGIGFQLTTASIK